MQETCLRLIGRKLLVSLAMEGKWAAEGLQGMDEGEDILKRSAWPTPVFNPSPSKVYRLPSTDFPPSSDSACMADSDEPSHFIKAMKPDCTASRQMIRFSLDAENSAAITKTVLAILEKAVVALHT